VVHLGGGLADFTAKYREEAVIFIDLTTKIHEKYLLIFHYSCWRTFACTPKAPSLPFHTPQQ
jgi:hypothetical protein